MSREVFLQQKDNENFAFVKVKGPEGIQLLPIRVDPTQLPLPNSKY